MFLLSVLLCCVHAGAAAPNEFNPAADQSAVEAPKASASATPTATPSAVDSKSTDSKAATAPSPGPTPTAATATGTAVKSEPTKPTPTEADKMAAKQAEDAKAAAKKAAASKVKVPDASWSYVRKQLKLAGLHDDFIESLKKHYEPKDLEEVVRLNVLLFLKKTDYHGVQVTDEAARDVAGFVKEHKSVLAKAQSQYGVDLYVIASLLWIESRYGKNLGRFHVPSVYLNLVQAPRKEIQDYLLTQTGRYAESDITPAQRKKILKRTHEKAKFAIGELYALQKAWKWKWNLNEDFRGSFSGAFGMPQFLPSSYVHFARAKDPQAQPALDQPDDAILSVGYFLKMHGWRQGSKKSHTKALRAYNNSADYGNAILNLAKKARAQI